ncbi:MAG TPA: class I SAM-dependent methyltransferase [Pyrinomonadaceae bacterium]|nr:class I SAM-dependent methyltransferase [Pyrinomonadaceae bacterium]
MYSVSGYGEMIADRVRTRAYLEALKQTVKPESVVLEIGSGLGLFAISAAQSGASKVYALEPDDVIELSRESARAANVADKITFLQALSTNVELPEQVDLIISDLRGVLPLFLNHIPSIIDARNRFLKPNGVLIPSLDRVWAGPVEAPEHYKKIDMWQDLQRDIDCTSARRIASNTWWKARARIEQLLDRPQCLTTLKYNFISSPNITGNLGFEISRDGVLHGWALWFDTNLFGEIGFSNHPEEVELIYGNAFFPLTEAIEVQKGDTINLSFRANLVNDDYVFSWNTEVYNSRDLEKRSFRQSTFFGVPFSANNLSKQATTHMPKLSMQGQIDRQVLTLMEDGRTIDEIAEVLTSEFPQYELTKDKALALVSKLSRIYSI